MIAHRIEWLVVYEIAIARAEPKLAPYLAPSTRTLYARPFICLLRAKFAEQPILDYNILAIGTWISSNSTYI